MVRIQALWRRFEGPTWALAVVIYGGWGLLTWCYGLLPWWLVLPPGAWVIAWQMSLQHELIHGHPTRNRHINAALGFPPLVTVAALRLLQDQPFGPPCGRRPDGPAPRPGILLCHRGGLEPDGAGVPDADPRQQHLRWPGADRAGALDQRLHQRRSAVCWPREIMSSGGSGRRMARRGGGAGLDLGSLRDSTSGLCGAVRLSGVRSGADSLLRGTPGGSGGRAPDGYRRERPRAGPAVPSQQPSRSPPRTARPALVRDPGSLQAGPRTVHRGTTTIWSIAGTGTWRRATC